MPLAQVPDFRALARQVLPAVVSIQVDQRVRVPTGPGDFFHRYFGGELPREYRNRGLGSGFVIAASGLILTNNHVVEDAERIEVTIDNGAGDERKLEAKVLGSAPRYDVAILQTAQPAGAQIAFLGDSGTTEIGDWVMAVGNPFGLTHSVSTGIISAKERRDVLPSGRAGLYNFLQTDASINPGNSGGPLINMRGEVIGINSAVNAAGAGIGFAIPINMVKEMLPELVAKGRFARSWLGVRIQPLNDELARSFGLAKATGALVAEVVPDGPADQAKLRPGDVVLQFDGKEVRQANDLPLFASMAGVGRTVPVAVWREGRRVEVRVALTENPDEGVGDRPEAVPTASELGLTIADVTPRMAQRLGAGSEGRVLVREVAPMSASEEAGIRPGDLLLQVGGRDVTQARQVAKLFGQAPAGSVIRLTLGREGRTVFAALKKGP